jgi:DNA-binding transcriptional MerR regulator
VTIDIHPTWGAPLGYTKLGKPFYLAKGAEDPPPDPTDGFNAAQQARVNALIAAERTKASETAKTKAAQDLATDLGMTLEEAKALIKAQKDATDKDLTEAQKARRDADAEKTAAEKERQTAKAEVFATRAERALVRAGVALPSVADDPDGKKADAVMDRVSKMLTVGVDATPEQIAEDVKTLKTTFPQLFVEGEETPKVPARRVPHTDPTTPPRRPTPSGDALSRGAERARTRFGRTTEKSTDQ